MYGLFLILLFYLLGCLVSALLDNFIPGSVIGMILLSARCRSSGSGPDT